MISKEELTMIIMTILTVVGVFLAIREFVCWYWKINEQIAIQKEQTELLKAIFKQLGGTITDLDSAEQDGEVDDLTKEKARLYDAFNKKKTS